MCRCTCTYLFSDYYVRIVFYVFSFPSSTSRKSARTVDPKVCWGWWCLMSYVGEGGGEAEINYYHVPSAHVQSLSLTPHSPTIRRQHCPARPAPAARTHSRPLSVLTHCANQDRISEFRALNIPFCALFSFFFLGVN